MFDQLFMLAPSAQEVVGRTMCAKLEAAAAGKRGIRQEGEADAASRAKLPIQRVGSVAVISVEGVMFKYGDPYWGEASTFDVAMATRAARMDDSVGGVVFVIDSPGGSTSYLAELVDEVAALSAKKPTIAHVSGMAASAGYMVAAATREIVAHRMDLIGSIGTRMALYDFSAYFEEKGIKAIPIDTGEHKSAGLPGTKITDAQVAEFQRLVDSFFADFLAVVKRGRAARMSAAKVEEAADGRIWTSGEALELGLIDRIGPLQESISRLAAVPPPAAQATLRAKVAAAAAVVAK